MIKSIFASMTGQSGSRSVLETCLLLSEMFEASVDCLHVHLDEATMTGLSRMRPFSTEILVEEQIQTLRREAKESATRAKGSFDSFCSAHADRKGQSLPFSWQDIPGIDTDETIARSRLYDLVVVGRDREAFTLGEERTGAIVMSCGRPVLLVPERAPKSLNGTVVVAWKNCAEAARAITVAQPLLSKARQVILAQVVEGSSDSSEASGMELLGNHLTRQGCRVETRVIKPDGSSAADAIHGIASELDADLVVMGAYGHSRLREYVFGGMTHQVIGAYAFPVLMFH